MSSNQEQPDGAATTPEAPTDQEPARRGRPPRQSAEPYPERKRESDRIHRPERNRRSRAKRAAEGATTVVVTVPQEARALFVKLAAAVRQDPGIIHRLSDVIAPRR